MNVLGVNSFPDFDVFNFNRENSQEDNKKDNNKVIDSYVPGTISFGKNEIHAMHEALLIV